MSALRQSDVRAAHRAWLEAEVTDASCAAARHDEADARRLAAVLAEAIGLDWLFRAHSEGQRAVDAARAIIRHRAIAWLRDGADAETLCRRAHQVGAEALRQPHLLEYGDAALAGQSCALLDEDFDFGGEEPAYAGVLVLDLLDELPPQQATVMAGIAWGLTPSDIAEATGLSRPRVTQLKQAGASRLREAVAA